MSKPQIKVQKMQQISLSQIHLGGCGVIKMQSTFSSKHYYVYIILPCVFHFTSVSTANEQFCYAIVIISRICFEELHIYDYHQLLQYLQLFQWKTHPFLTNDVKFLNRSIITPQNDAKRLIRRFLQNDLEEGPDRCMLLIADE